MQDKEGDQENALVAADRAWFAKRLREGFTRTSGVLKAIKNDTLDGDEDKLERLAHTLGWVPMTLTQLTSLRAVMEAIPGRPGDVFRSWFSNEEWLELEASEASIASRRQVQLQMLWPCKYAINLTACDTDEVAEQSTLVQGCEVLWLLSSAAQR